MFLFQKVSLSKSTDSVESKISQETENSTMERKREGFNKHKLQGLLLMAAAGFYITLSNSLVQYVYKKSQKRVSAYFILFIRSGIIVSLNSIFMYWGSVKPVESIKDLPFLCCLGGTGIGSILFVYLALERMPVGDATVIQFTAPVLTAVFSFLFLSKGCSIFDSICGLVSFLGVIVMTRPTILFGTSTKYHKPKIGGGGIKKSIPVDNMDGKYTLGVAFAILGAIFVALFYVLNKVMGRKLDMTLTILYPGLFGMIIPPIIMLIIKDPFELDTSWQVTLSVLLIGVLSFVHLMFVAESLQMEEAGPLSLVRNLDIVYAFILQYLLLRNPPHWMTLVGAVVVISATTLMAVRRIVIAKYG